MNLVTSCRPVVFMGQGVLWRVSFTLYSTGSSCPLQVSCVTLSTAEVDCLE